MLETGCKKRSLPEYFCVTEKPFGGIFNHSRRGRLAVDGAIQISYFGPAYMRFHANYINGRAALKHVHSKIKASEFFEGHFINIPTRLIQVSGST
jgi:hypothetical protein